MITILNKMEMFVWKKRGIRGFPENVPGLAFIFRITKKILYYLYEKHTRSVYKVIAF